MAKHGQEPWSVRVQEDRVEILDANGRPILELYSQEGVEHLLIHAGRIMACVNLCAGTSTEELDYILRGREWQKNRERPA